MLVADDLIHASFDLISGMYRLGITTVNPNFHALKKENGNKDSKHQELVLFSPLYTKHQGPPFWLPQKVRHASYISRTFVLIVSDFINSFLSINDD